MGDQQYPDSDARQLNYLDVGYRYESGPRGPKDKGLDRTRMCPNDAVWCNVRPVPEGLESESLNTLALLVGTSKAISLLAFWKGEGDNTAVMNTTSILGVLGSTAGSLEFKYAEE